MQIEFQQKGIPQESQKNRNVFTIRQPRFMSHGVKKLLVSDVRSMVLQLGVFSLGHYQENATLWRIKRKASEVHKRWS